MSGQNSPFAERAPRSPRYQPLVIVLAAVAAGITVDHFCPLRVSVWSVLTAISMLVWGFLLRRGRVGAASLILLAAAASTAGAWHHCRWHWFPADDMGNFSPSKAEPVCLEAVALGLPREIPPPPPDPMQGLRRESSFRLEIAAVAIRDRDVWKPISGRAGLLVEGAAPKVEAGDRLKIFGKLAAPTAAHNAGDFDYADYLRANRVRTQIQSKTAACVSRLAPGRSCDPARLLDRMRLTSAKIFERYLDPEQAELASAILLGEREHIDPGQNQAYMSTGTIHVLSISGLHVGVLAGALLWLMRWFMLPRLLGAALVAVVTGSYALMVEANPPVIRAVILVLVVCGSLWLHRRQTGLNSLAAAGLVVLAINPADLFHIGAQLSFLCVAVLIWCGAKWVEQKEVDPLEMLVRKSVFFFSLTRWTGNIRDVFCFGFAIWLLTTPLTMARFHLLSPVALVINGVLWIPMTAGLLAGFALLFCGAFLPPLAGFCGLVCNLNLWVMDQCIRWADATPGSHFWVAGPNDWWLAVLYGGLGLSLIFPKIRPPRRWCIAALVGWIGVGFLASLAGRHSGNLQCTFVSVGHGSATVVELPSGQTLLCDAGQMGAPHRAAKSIAGYLWSRGITHLDAVVLSHADIDHYNALPDLLKRFSVAAVYVSPVMFDDQTATLEALKASIDRNGTPCRELRAGQRLFCGEDCRIEVLHPPPRGILASNNANSLVLAIEHCGRRILLPGDLDGQGMKNLLAEEPMPCTVLLAPHHGSRQSNSRDLAAWCQPKWVVLSGDGRWSTPETDATYRAVGGQTLHTHRDGAITLTFDDRATKVETFLKSCRPAGHEIE